MDPLETERLYERVKSELETASSERVQLFCIDDFLKAIDGAYKQYESYLIQLFEYFPELKNPLFFTGVAPENLEALILRCQTAIDIIPELKENTGLQHKIICLEKGLRQIYGWLGIRNEDPHLGGLQVAGELQYNDAKRAGEVFIPVVERNAESGFSGRLRKLSVQIVGRSKKKEHELRPIFGVIGADAGNIGKIPANVAGALFQKSTTNLKYWVGTANFELNHAWHAGNSANLALAALFYCEMLKAENKREYFKLNPGIAVTGNIDEQGSVLEVDSETLEQKIEAAFYSWVQVIVVPAVQLEEASLFLEKKEAEYPNRNLFLKGVDKVEEMFFDRRLTLHRKTSLIEHAAKKMWKRKNTAVVTIVFLILLSVIARLLYGPIDKNPVAIEYSGDFLVLENKNGAEVARIEAGSDAMVSLELNYTFNPKVLLYDLNEDGTNEIIWAKNATNTERNRTFVQAYSVVADSVIWEIPITMDHEFPRQHFELEKTMDVQELGIVRSGGKIKLAVVANLTMFFPAMVVIVNIGTGEIEQEYVHTGKISDMAAIDINEDGDEEIILTGVNNAFWMASILVLDPENIQGHSPLNGDYVINDLDKADEMHYILMPKTITGEYLSYMEKQAIGYRIFTNEERKTLMVEIYETQRRLGSISERSSYFVYLNYDMQATGFATSDLYDIIARELYEEGHIPFIPDYDYWESIKESLQYWNKDEQ